MKLIAERLNGSALYTGEGVRLIVGDSRHALMYFEDNYFQSCITSPPYWSLRDYGIVGQIGAEDSVDEYITDLVTIFREVRRTLRDDGTLWLTNSVPTIIQSVGALFLAIGLVQRRRKG